MVFGQLHYTKRVVFMPFLVAEILNFQGSAHHVGVGSLSYLEYEDSVQELSIALYEAIFTIKDSSNEYACISYIQKSIINRFTKLYHKSKEVQKLQSINLAIDENKDLESSYQKTDDCIFKTDLESLLKKRTVLEQKIIYMISQGYTDEEIGRFLGYTRQYINRLKKKILKN